MLASKLEKVSQKRLYCKYTLEKIVYKNKWERMFQTKERYKKHDIILGRAKNFRQMEYNFVGNSEIVIQKIKMGKHVEVCLLLFQKFQIMSYKNEGSQTTHW